MEISKQCVWVDYDIKTTHRRDDGKLVESTTKPGWYAKNGIDINFGELANVDIYIGKFYKTKGGYIVGASKPCYVSTYNGPIQVEFYIEVGSDNNRGRVIRYDNNLKHISSGHMKSDSAFDIIGVLMEDLPDRCPHCDGILPE